MSIQKDNWKAEVTQEFIDTLNIIPLETIKRLLMERPEVSGVVITTEQDIEEMEKMDIAYREQDYE